MSTPALPDAQFLDLRHEGWVLHLTLARPEVRNAMSFAMVEELVAVFDALADRQDVRAVVIRGAGGNFCSGGDIKDMAPGEPESVLSRSDPRLARVITLVVPREGARRFRSSRPPPRPVAIRPLEHPRPPSW